MDNTYFTLTVILVVIFFILRTLWRRNTHNQAASSVNEVFSIWSALGPFDNGESSAMAFKASYAAIHGPENANEFTEKFEEHKNAFNSDPVKWESLRRETLKSSKIDEESIELAKGFLAIEELNNDPNNGVKFTASTTNNGQIDISFEGEQTDQSRDRSNRYIAEMYGEDLINAKSDSAKQLLHFIETLYRSAHEEDPETPLQIGDTILKFLAYCDEYPEDEFSSEFSQLFEAYQQAEEEYNVP